MKRIPAIFRTFGFWTGLLIFWSIWWLWQDSMRFGRLATLSPAPGIVLRVNSAFGDTTLEFVQISSATGRWRFFSSKRRLDATGVSRFPLSLDFKRHEIYAPKGAYHEVTVLTLPYWVMMLVSVLLWFVLLAWRLAVRRRRRQGNPFAQAVETASDRDEGPLGSRRVDRQGLSR